MKVEVCDICHKEVGEFNRTEVIIKDYNGMIFDFGMTHREKRKWKGVICDRCLSMLRNEQSCETCDNYGICFIHKNIKVGLCESYSGAKL